MKLWDKGNINELLEENRIKKKDCHQILEKIFSKYKQLTETGNVNGALRLLTNNMSNGTLPSSNNTLQLLHLKHPEYQEAHNRQLLQDSIKQVHSIVYDDIDKALVMKVAVQ